MFVFNHTPEFSIFQVENPGCEIITGFCEGWVREEMEKQKRGRIYEENKKSAFFVIDTTVLFGIDGKSGTYAYLE